MRICVNVQPLTFTVLLTLLPHVSCSFVAMFKYTIAGSGILQGKIFSEINGCFIEQKKIFLNWSHTQQNDHAKNEKITFDSVHKTL